MGLERDYNHNIEETEKKANSDAIEGAAELLKILHFVIKHNLPHTTLFEPLVDLILSINQEKIGKIRRATRPRGLMLTC